MQGNSPFGTYLHEGAGPLRIRARVGGDDVPRPAHSRRLVTRQRPGRPVYRQTFAASRAEPLVHVFTNLTGVGNVEVNAFQRLSSVMVQKSIREGFGLVVSEALWKGTPVVAGRAGGIPLQMADGVGGILVDGVEECAAGILALLRDRERAGELGRRGHDRVREHFLLPRLLLNEVSLMDALAAERPIGARDPSRDPVCGMVVARRGFAADFEGRGYVFCSAECRNRFVEEPRRYAGSDPT